jgi:hypothetical protein
MQMQMQGARAVKSMDQELAWIAEQSNYVTWLDVI